MRVVDINKSTLKFKDVIDINFASLYNMKETPMSDKSDLVVMCVSPDDILYSKILGIKITLNQQESQALDVWHFVEQTIKHPDAKNFAVVTRIDFIKVGTLISSDPDYHAAKLLYHALNNFDIVSDKLKG